MACNSPSSAERENLTAQRPTGEHLTSGAFGSVTGQKVEPPECLEAEVFHRRMDRGRNKPLLISARGTSGLKQCVIKLTAGLELRTLAPLPFLCEWVAAALAPHLGVMAPLPYEVVITEAFAQVLQSVDPELGRLALA